MCTRRREGDLLAKAVEGESEEDVVDVNGGATLGNGIKIVGDNLGLLDKDIACVVYGQKKGRRISINRASSKEGMGDGPWV